jgi:hypothetical protein
MASSPFAKGGAATTEAPAPAKAAPKAAKPEAAAEDSPLDASPAGSSAPIAGRPNDPFNAVAPSGVSGYKPLYFVNQLVLMHATETGSMKTSSNTPEKPTSEFVRFDIIPLTAPESFTFTNIYGDEETCEPYSPGERLDDVLIFNSALVREGKRMLDNGTHWILGRIVKGNRKEGQSAPYIIVEGDEEDQAIYQAWREEAMKAARK